MRIGENEDLFEEKQDIPENNPCVAYSSYNYPIANEVMDYLEQFSTVESSSDSYQNRWSFDHGEIDDIILAEIKNQLTIYTDRQNVCIVSDTLTNFQHQLIVVR